MAKVIQSTADSSVVEGFLALKDALCGFPAKIHMDNAIACQNTASRRYLKERGVEIIHGMAGISRCQASVERAIGSLTRQICRMKTAKPSIPFYRLVAEAVYVINSTPSTALAAGVAPKELHFIKAPSDFLHHTTATGGDANIAIKAARDAGRKTLVEDVKRYIKRQRMISPTDYTSKLKVGSLCLRKRTVFPTQSPRKLCYKLTMNCYRITSKLGTNAWRCISLIDGETAVLPGDHLVQVKGLTESELVALCREMEITAAKEALETENPGGGEGTTARRETRSRTKAARNRRTDACVDARLDELFK